MVFLYHEISLASYVNLMEGHIIPDFTVSFFLQHPSMKCLDSLAGHTSPPQGGLSHSSGNGEDEENMNEDDLKSQVSYQK